MFSELFVDIQLEMLLKIFETLELLLIKLNSPNFSIRIQIANINCSHIEF